LKEYKSVGIDFQKSEECFGIGRNMASSDAERSTLSDVERGLSTTSMMKRFGPTILFFVISSMFQQLFLRRNHFFSFLFLFKLDFFFSFFFFFFCLRGCLGVSFRLFFKVFFVWKYIKIIVFIFKKLFLTLSHQNYLKIPKNINLKERKE